MNHSISRRTCPHCKRKYPVYLRHEPECLRDRIAKALDQTHAVGEDSSRTFMARQRLATFLDLGGMARMEDIRWLETVARLTHEPQPKE